MNYQLSIINYQLKQRRLQMYLEAEEKILQGQSYTIGDRTLQRADLQKIQAVINQLSAELSEGSSGRVGFLIPFDR